MRFPTIEILFQTGFLPSGERHPLQHFQFLRRVICSGVPKEEPPLSKLTLENSLRTQGTIDNWERDSSSSNNDQDVAFNNEGSSSNHDQDDRPVNNEGGVASSSDRDEDVASNKSPSNNQQLKPKTKEKRVAQSTGKTIQQPVAQSIGKTTKHVQKAHRIQKAKEKRVVKSSGKITKHSKKALRIQKAKDTREFNKLYNKGEITATRMLYDIAEDEYYVSNLGGKEGKEGEIHRKERVVDISRCNKFLVEVATRSPGEWVGPSIGDSGDAEAPDIIRTAIPTIYQQHNRPFCLIYSFASALFYCGFKKQAQNLAQQALAFASKDFDTQIEDLLSLLVNLVPWIAGPTLYGVRTNRHDRKKRFMTWEKLFSEFTIYPTIVIPILPNGACTHAFCIVDDLIFDSITSHALQLREESVKWIFNGSDSKIYKAYKFETKKSPEKNKVSGKYKRQMRLNWNHSSEGIIYQSASMDVDEPSTERVCDQEAK